jgi:hypothetical protein
MNIIKYLFFPNWTTLEIFKSTYKTYMQYQSNFGQIVEIPNSERKEVFICEVQYSKVRDSYRVSKSGYIPDNPKSSECYEKAIMFIKEKKKLK